MMFMPVAAAIELDLILLDLIVYDCYSYEMNRFYFDGSLIKSSMLSRVWRCFSVGLLVIVNFDSIPVPLALKGDY